MEKDGIFVVSFGTVVDEARQLELGGVEGRLQGAFPHLPLRSAYTSPTVRTLLKKRGILVPSLEEALRQVEEEGWNRLFVVPTHLLPGHEYEDIVKTVERRRRDLGDRPPRIWVIPPLLEWGQKELAHCLSQHYPKREGEGVVWMGHGSTHPGHQVYSSLQSLFRTMGREDMVVGTLEVSPKLEDLFPQLKARGIKRVRLIPLLMVAGTHVKEDMVGDHPESWKRSLEQEGFEVEAVLEGLGRLPQVQQLYVQRLQQAMKTQWEGVCP